MDPLTIADLLAEWDAEHALDEAQEAIGSGLPEPPPRTRRLIAEADAMRFRARANLADRLAAQADTTDAERERLRWYADYYGQEADRLSPQ